MEKVSQELKARVDAEVARCIAVATAKYGRTFETPKVTYDLRGRTAGQAWHGKNLVRLNAVLLNDNQDEMVNDTVPHEVAHLIDFTVNPRDGGRTLQFTQGGPRMTRASRAPHGPSWQAIMRLFGRAPTRTHQMDTTRARTTATYVYVCPTCLAEIHCGPRHHGRLQRGASFRRKACRHSFGRVDYVAVIGRDGKRVDVRTGQRTTPVTIPVTPAVAAQFPLWGTVQKPVVPVRSLIPTTAKPVQVVKPAPAPGTFGNRDKELGRPGTIGRLIAELLLQGALNDTQIVAAAVKKFPEAKIAKSYPAWYRAKLKRVGVL